MVGKIDGNQGFPGFTPPGFRPEYGAYRSPHGPQYKVGFNMHGFNANSMRNVARTVGPFGVVLGVAGIYFFSDVPRVRIDILQRVPVVGEYFKREVPPEDNPF